MINENEIQIPWRKLSLELPEYFSIVEYFLILLRISFNIQSQTLNFTITIR